jgi:hypothetical protein
MVRGIEESVYRVIEARVISIDRSDVGSSHEPMTRQPDASLD